jgi:hypothetical protein
MLEFENRHHPSHGHFECSEKSFLDGSIPRNREASRRGEGNLTGSPPSLSFPYLTRRNLYPYDINGQHWSTKVIGDAFLSVICYRESTPSLSFGLLAGIHKGIIASFCEAISSLIIGSLSLHFFWLSRCH